MPNSSLFRRDKFDIIRGAPCRVRMNKQGCCVSVAHEHGLSVQRAPPRSGRTEGSNPFLATKKTTIIRGLVAPPVGFEPTTYRLTAECSTAELRRHIKLYFGALGCQPLSV